MHVCTPACIDMCVCVCVCVCVYACTYACVCVVSLVKCVRMYVCTLACIGMCVCAETLLFNPELTFYKYSLSVTPFASTEDITRPTWDITTTNHFITLGRP